MTQLAGYSSAAFTNSSGLAVAASASVEVRRESDGALASIFSDEAAATPLANPFTADTNGRFAFYAAGLLHGYRIKVTSGADTHTLENVPIGTAGQVDASGIGPSLMQAADAPAARSLIGRSPMLARSTNTMLGSSDIGKTIRATGTFTQTFDACATLADGWFVHYRNNGTGIITLDPNASETIDGATTITLGPGEACTIVCDGANFITSGGRTDGEFRTVQTFTASGTWTAPAGLKRVKVTVIGPGGAGGGAAATTAGQLSAGGGGGAGGCAVKMISAAAAGASQTVTVGTGGAGVSGGSGNNGSGSSSFGALVTAGAGTGGTNSLAANTVGVAINGSAGGTGASGDINGRGGPGGGSFVATTGYAISGHGGNSMFGGGGLGPVAGTAGGSAILGGGGSGTTQGTGGAALTGGNGGNGIVVVEEFY